MIADFFINILTSLFTFLVQLLPVAAPIPAAALQWVGWFHTGLQLIGFMLPMDQFFIILGLWLGIEGVILAFTSGERGIKILKP